MIIGVDFDGTMSEHVYPDIGKEVPLAFKTCKQLQEDGHKLILYTMRSGEELDQAVKWCKEKGVEFWGINNNPHQHTWTQSPKVYAHIYIDDATYGCPLITLVGYNRPMVDWSAVYDYIKGKE